MTTVTFRKPLRNSKGVLYSAPLGRFTFPRRFDRETAIQLAFQEALRVTQIGRYAQTWEEAHRRGLRAEVRYGSPGRPRPRRSLRRK